MMRKKLLVIGLVLSYFTAFAQLGRPVPIDSVQFVSNQNLALGIDKPDNFDYGDEVVIEGVVCKMHPGFYGLSATSRKSTMLFQKDKRGRWSGVEVMAQPYGGVNLATFLATTKYYENFIPGFTVKCKAQVGDYQGNTQLLIRDVETEVTDLTPTEIEPVVLELDSFKSIEGDDQLVTGEPYEHVYVEFRNVTVVDRTSSGNGRWFWSIQNSRGIKMQIRDFSGYYRSDGNTDSTITADAFVPPSEGTTLEFLRGVIVQDNSGYRIAPLVPSDLGLGEFVPPVISNFQIVNPIPMALEDVEINLTATDDGSVSGVSIYWALGVDATNFTKVAMSNTDGDDWKGSIPGQVDGSIIKFYVEAVDNENNPSYFPNNNGLNSYIKVLDGGLKQISDIQNTPRTDGNSIYNNMTLNGIAISAVVTGSLNYLGMTSIQDAPTAWSGIFIKSQAGDGISDWKTGDLVRINKATVIEEFGVTYLSDITYETISSGNGLPNPIKNVSLDSIAARVYDYTEAYEGVLLEWENVVVADTNADAPNYYGEWSFSTSTDAGAPQVRVDDVSPYIEFEFGSDSLEIGQELDYVRGIFFYSFGNYKLLPRDKNDIAGFKTVYPESVNEINEAINLKVFPNPANDLVQVSFEMKKADKLAFSLLDMTGRIVWNENMAVSSGTSYLQVPVSNFNKGNYILKIVGNTLNTATYIVVK